MSKTIQISIYFNNEPTIKFNFLSEKLNWRNVVTLIESSRNIDLPITLYYKKEDDTIETLQNHSQFESLLMVPEIKGLSFYGAKDLVIENVYTLSGHASARLTQLIKQNKSTISQSQRIARWVGILSSFIAQDTTDHHFGYEFEVLDKLIERKAKKSKRHQEYAESLELQDPRLAMFGGRHGYLSKRVRCCGEPNHGESSDEIQGRDKHRGGSGRHTSRHHSIFGGFGGKQGSFGKQVPSGKLDGANAEESGNKQGPFEKSSGGLGLSQSGAHRDFFEGLSGRVNGAYREFSGVLRRNNDMPHRNIFEGLNRDHDVPHRNIFEALSGRYDMLQQSPFGGLSRGTDVPHRDASEELGARQDPFGKHGGGHHHGSEKSPHCGGCGNSSAAEESTD